MSVVLADIRLSPLERCSYKLMNIPADFTLISFELIEAKPEAIKVTPGMA